MSLRFLPSFVFLLSAALLPATEVPELPATPHDYAGLILPDHFLTNDLPGNNPFQNAVITNDNTPVGNPITNAGATLGRVLFYDKKLSANGTVACASCHVQANGFSDPRPLSLGFDGGETRRHSMGLTNARFYEPGKFFWDERAETLEDQVLMPFQDPVEMGLTLEQVVSITQAQDYYPSLFTAAFGDDTIDADRIAKALAQFVRSMVSVNSRYDQGRATVNDPLDDFPNFTAAENRGKQLFMDRDNNGTVGSNGGGPVSCIDCHVSEAFLSPPRGTPHASATSAATNNGLDLVSTTDLGIAETTGNIDDTGRFKVPSLRNIGVTAPYMHDGRFDDLQDVMRFYDRDIESHAQLAQILVGNNGQARRIPLNGQARNDLIAFLHTLTDQSMLTDEKFSDPFVTVPDPVDAAQLINLSTRAALPTDAPLLVSGFVLEGSGTRTLLIRGVGPELIEFGVNDPLPTPRITLFSGDTALATNQGWALADNAATIASTAETVGAFPLSTNRADSALLADLSPGAYTVHLTDDNTGTGLIEIYDAGSGDDTRLVNLSTRATVATGGELIVPGFVVTGEGATTFLIRAVGPSLAGFGVGDALPDPRLSLYRDGQLITTNDNWFVSGTSAQTAAIAEQVGAFALPEVSLDAGVTVTLQPGPYTVHVDDTTGAGGTVLIEIYAVP